MQNLFMLTFLISLIGIPAMVIMRFVKKDTAYWKYAGASLMVFVLSFAGVGMTGEPLDVEEEATEDKVEEVKATVVEESAEEIAERKAEEDARREAKKESDAEKEAKRKEEASRKKAEEENAKLVTEYRAFVSRSAGNFSNHLDDLGVQTSTFSYSDRWISETARVVTNINETTAEVINYDLEKVPEEYMEAHEAYVSGSLEYSEAMDLFVEGVDTGNPNLIEAASEKMEQGNVYIVLATELTKEISNSEGI